MATMTSAPAPKVNYNPNQMMATQKADSSEQMARYNRLLEQQAKAQISGAEAGYAQTRDAQLAGLQKSLNQSVLDGQLSVKQAEVQFEQQKKSIQEQAYKDGEITGQTAQTMGIQNSQQMLGMVASDQARNQSLNNDNMSARDMKIYEVNNRLNAIRSNVSIDMVNVEASYGNAVTQAKSQIDANMFGQQFEMQIGEYNRLQNLQSQYDQMGLQQQYTQQNMAIEQGYNKENMAIQQKYTLDNMSVQQKYTLQQFAVQHGYDLKKMSINQVYDLAKMAKQNGYDVGLQNDQQAFQGSQAQLDRNFQGTQNSLDRSFQGAQAQADRSFQGSQNSLNRSHDVSMTNLKSNLSLKEEQALYERQRTRENNAYNVKGSTEYKLRSAQEKAGINSAMQQYGMQTLTDLQMGRVATMMESLPKLSGSPKQSEITAYNSKVKAVNDQIKSTVGKELYDYLKIPTYQSGGSASTSTSTAKKASTTSASTEKYQSYLNNKTGSASDSRKYTPNGY